MLRDEEPLEPEVLERDDDELPRSAELEERLLLLEERELVLREEEEELRELYPELPRELDPELYPLLPRELDPELYPELRELDPELRELDELARLLDPELRELELEPRLWLPDERELWEETPELRLELDRPRWANASALRRTVVARTSERTPNRFMGCLRGRWGGDHSAT